MCLVKMVSHYRFQTTLWLDDLRCASLHYFLSQDCKVTSFQQMEKNLFVVLTNQTPEEYVTFTNYVEFRFGANILGQKKLCPAKCRDNTLCLNSITQEDYCWRHSVNWVQSAINDLSCVQTQKTEKYGGTKMKEQTPVVTKRENLSDLLNRGSVFGMGFSDRGNYELSKGKQYEVSNCFRPNGPQPGGPGPCICYGRQRR